VEDGAYLVGEMDGQGIGGLLVAEARHEGLTLAGHRAQGDYG